MTIQFDLSQETILCDGSEVPMQWLLSEDKPFTVNHDKNELTIHYKDGYSFTGKNSDGFKSVFMQGWQAGE